MSLMSNYIGLDGIEFVEFSSPDPKSLERLFTNFGFKKTTRHENKNITLYKQGQINLLLNDEPQSFADSFKNFHGPCLSSMGWRVKNAKEAYSKALERGAKPCEKGDYVVDGLPVPAIKGIGDSIIYLIEDDQRVLYDRLGFKLPLTHREFKGEMGFELIDHLTNNVPKGTMLEWSNFYKNIFGFEEVRYFDIRGVKTGLTSYALRSPCKKFCIPINEGTEDKSQINEYLREYKGAGVQHLAFATNDIIKTVSSIKKAGIETLEIDDQYYEEVFDRVPKVTEDHLTLKDLNILVDGDEEGYLLQIFTKNVVGPIFIEIIQRKNHYSFGEGNFGALFRSIEKDQEKRGVL